MCINFECSSRTSSMSRTTIIMIFDHLPKFKVMFGFRKYKGKKKNVKENYFLMLDCPIKYSKEN